MNNVSTWEVPSIEELSVVGGTELVPGADGNDGEGTPS
jgi:hypothetical protein